MFMPSGQGSLTASATAASTVDPAVPDVPDLQPRYPNQQCCDKGHCCDTPPYTYCACSIYWCGCEHERNRPPGK